jgi:hypothetical protein
MPFAPRDWPYPKPYPDTNAIPRIAAGPPPFPAQLTSRDPAKLYPIHDHMAFVDKHGEGVTDVVASHFHRVKDGRVLPDESDGHVHRLTGLPAGVGAPVRNYGNG